MPTAIQFDALTVRFGDLLAVDALSFEVAAGEIFGFLGPNGAGKSTALRVLLDLIRPDAGGARVLGRPVREGGGSLRARLGYLPGDLALFPELTGRATLDLLAGLHGGRAPRREEVLERLGFPREALARKVRTYSTGMRQMLGITAAFQHDPQLWVLDEPTTGLDPVVRRSVLELVRECAAGGRTVLFSSHVLAEVEHCAHRVGLIHRGRLHLVDSIASLRQRWPRRVRLRAGGREEVFETTEPPDLLLRRLPRDGLEDLEIRPASLEDVFRGMLSERRP